MPFTFAYCFFYNSQIKTSKGVEKFRQIWQKGVVMKFTTNNIDWLTPRGLEEEYGFSRSRQARLRMERKIPFSKIGSYIRYSRKAINQWLDDARIC